MLVGQILISTLVAALSALASAQCGNGFAVVLLIYSSAGSLTLLGLAMLAHLRTAEARRDSRRRR
jgi:tellurite resistance protein TehA-like permease